VTDVDVANALLEEAHVAVVPGSAFGLAPFIRISYALDDADLLEARQSILAFCASCH
jgi:aspartate aminotransferase